MTITINRKKTEVPKLGFEEMVKMEAVVEISIADALAKRQLMLLTTAFVVVVADVDKDEAMRLIEQHVMGGGSITPITKAFMKAMDESDFFKKMLGKDKPANPSKEEKETKDK